MEYVSTARPQRSLFAGLFTDYTALRTEFARRSQVARTRRTLERMTDRQLRDIGISRHLIARRAFESVYGQAPFDPRS